MLQSILKLKQVKPLDRKAKVNSIGGRFNNCPTVGQHCREGVIPILPCANDVQILVCVNGYWEYDVN